MAELHGTLSATSNYLGRGYSRSNNKFAFQANIDYQHESGAYAGSSLSNVDFGDSDFSDHSRVEATPYVGWSLSVYTNWRADLQWTRYIYDGKIFGQRADYNEFYLLIHYRDLISANISFSDDFYNQGKSAGNYQLTGRYPLTDYLQISASGGYSQTKNVLEYDYIYWNAGLTYFYKFLSIDLRYVDAMESEGHHSEESINDWLYDPSLIKPTVLFTLSVGF